MIQLKGQIRVQRLAGKINMVPAEGGGGPLQAKTAYPSHSEQIIAPDDDYYGLVAVTVKPVPRKPAAVVSVATEYSNATTIEKTINITTDDCEFYIDERNPQYYLFGGVQLPGFPEVDAEYSHGVILLSSSNGTYYLYRSNGACTQKYSLGNSYISNYSGGHCYKYKEGWPDWLCVGIEVMGMTGGSGLIWASHDVTDKDGDVYFAGSDPVLVE